MKFDGILDLSHRAVQYQKAECHRPPGCYLPGEEVAFFGMMRVLYS
ncbi:hypothetical protein [uncultured Cohaesibacter sp.]|nr:hypothetical protein [uncultured Cohaesibacter sp.]